MDALLVDGDEIELTPDPPWSWMMGPVKLSVMATPGHKIKAKGKFTIWEAEILQAGLLAAGKTYTAPGFATPGSVITCTFIVNPATMSQVYKDSKLPIATVATSGTFLATVVPAVNPSTGIPDPLIAKTGTWKVVTEKQSVAKSGQPKADATDGDDADSKAASGSGTNSAEPGADENKVHWVGVKYQDIDGNPLPEHRVAISPPDGRRTERKTTASGASRVDGVRATGEAIASLLESSLRPGVKQPPVPFIGVTIVDENGLPIEGIGLGFTSPSGAELAGETNTKGSLRLDKLPELGEWKVRATDFPDGQFPGSGNGTGVGEGDDSSNGSNNGDGAGTDKPTKRLYLLEVPDVLCRTSSCVILPEGEAPSASKEHPAVSGVNLCAAAIRLCEERPEFKVLIAAHTDSVDNTKDNQVLSNERAQMALAILTGDREAYKKLAHARHRISDIKQMLHWCVTAYPDVFTCDLGPIDDKDNTWKVIHTFESEFNYFKYYFQASQTPDLELTGSMGPNNWGALFDVLQFGIARELGVLVREVAPLREKIRWLDDGRKALGFSEHHPIDAVGRDNYESQSNRRVELLFFDEKDILPDVGAAESDPASSEIYLPGVYERKILSPDAVAEPDVDDRTLIMPVVPDDVEHSPEESVGLEHTRAGQTVGSTRPGQPRVRYDSGAQLLFVNVDRATASTDGAQVVYFGARFWDVQSRCWLMPDGQGGTQSADEPSFQIRHDPNPAKRSLLFGDGKQEVLLGKVIIHQADSFGFPKVHDAADESKGRYEVQRNNWWATKDEIVEGLKEAKEGDIFIFFGHAALSKKSGKVAGIVGEGMFGNQIITTSELRRAVSSGQRPAAVVLAACQSDQLLDALIEGGAGVAFGVDVNVSNAALKGFADRVAKTLVERKTIREASDAGQQFLDSLNAIASNNATVQFALRDNIDPDLNLVDNGLKAR